MLANLGRLCARKSSKNVITTTYLRTISYCIICSNPRTTKIAQSTSQIFQNTSNLQVFSRYKSKGGKSQQKKESTDSESDERDSDDVFLDKIQDKNTKTLKVNVTSMRLDGIIKAGLGMSRNKIEVIFYESKIRLNGEKALKKSVHINAGDEIDVIKGINVKNPDFLTIARIEVISATPNEDSITVKLRRFKSLTVENYKGKDVWEP